MPARYTRKFARRPRKFARKYPRRPVYNRLRRTFVSRNVHSYKRFDDISATGVKTISCNFGATGYTTDTRNFTLADVTDYAEFTALYDKYMITGVKVTFDYGPDAATPTASSSAHPKLWVKIDHDDSSSPSLDEMTSSAQARCLRFNAVNNTRSIFLRPTSLYNIYNGVSPDAHGPAYRRWIDCNDTGVPHYGLKLLAQGLPSVNLGAISMRFKYYLKFKGVQ